MEEEPSEAEITNGSEGVEVKLAFRAFEIKSLMLELA
jgi:hypothetical protein